MILTLNSWQIEKILQQSRISFSRLFIGRIMAEIDKKTLKVACDEEQNCSDRR